MPEHRLQNGFATLASARPARFGVALAVVTASAAFEASAWAAPRMFVALQYEVAPDATGCPDAAAFSGSVQRQLGYDPFRGSTERRVAVQIKRTESGFDGDIRWSDAHGAWVGDRQLSSQRAECSEIAANVAFAVAVEIELMEALEGPAHVLPPPKPAASPRVKPQAGASAVSPRSPAAAARTPNEAKLEVSAGFGPALGLGLAPSPMGLGRVFVMAKLNPFSLQTDFDAALPVTHHETDARGFTLHRLAGEAAACGHVRIFAACLTGAFGRLEARGFGVDVPASSAGFFTQLGARIVVTYEFSDRYFVSAHGESLVMLSRWKVLLNDESVWTTPRVSALFGIAFGARFF